MVNKATIDEYDTKTAIASELDVIKGLVNDATGDVVMNEVRTANGCVISVRWA